MAGTDKLGPTGQAAQKLSSISLIHDEEDYAAHNYHPIPVVFDKAEGVFVWDPEGKRYYDFLSAYSAVNQGHCHPKIVQAMMQQVQKLTLSSRAFYNSVFPQFAKYITEFFGYDMVLPMNTGAEAVETALKLARKWGYMKKGIAENEAVIISCKGCFHGRTIAIISMSSDPDCRSTFGPFLPGLALLVSVEYGDVESLRAALTQYGKRVAGFLVEPIQGEAGVVVPPAGYLSECYKLCKENNVLFMADEIQTGLARTGRMLCCDWEGFKPDVVILGKAISGGMLPISAVLSSRDVMLCIKPGEHGSTYGGNPLASAVAIAALQVLKDEKLAEKADKLGERLRAGLNAIRSPLIQNVRGKGLLMAIDVDPSASVSAWDICVQMKELGVLAKPTHNHIIRLAPPLTITEQQLDDCIQIVAKVFNDVSSLRKDAKPSFYAHEAK